jgi:hypothetical protein
MLLWQGACVVHERFKADALIALQKKHPEAATLVPFTIRTFTHGGRFNQFFVRCHFVHFVKNTIVRCHNKGLLFPIFDRIN